MNNEKTLPCGNSTGNEGTEENEEATIGMLQDANLAQNNIQEKNE